MSKILGVDYIAPLKIQSGMGCSSRAYYKALNLLENISINPIAYERGFEHHAKVRFRDASKKDYLLNEDVKALILHQNADGFYRMREDYAHQISAHYAKKIAAWVWELSQFQEQWKKESAALDEIWVPSNFVKNSISKVVDKSIVVIPYPVTISKISATNFCESFRHPEYFLFGYFFDASSFVERKNPVALLRAFEEVRRKYDHCKLILKIGHAHKFLEYLGEKKIGSELLESVKIIDKNLPSDQLYGLMNELDCYVSPHRSEGFGLTVAEAMFLGKPVIASDYSSTQDFLDQNIAYPVPVDLTTIEVDLGPYQKGLFWAEINHSELVKAMISVVENQALAIKKGAAAKKYMKEKYSYSAISKLMGSRLR